MNQDRNLDPLENAPGASPTPRRERRRRLDRRAISTGGRRGPPRPRWQRNLLRGAQYSLMIFGTLAAIIVSVRYSSPIYANQPTVAQSLLNRAPVTRAVLEPTAADSTMLERLEAHPQFQADRRAFADDLVRTGRMSPARADSIAYYAVREAYLRGVPPAVIFGVMLAENATFISHARSNVGAIGLMQIYGKVWLEPLHKLFGRDLQTDSTNLRYGVYILGHYLKTREAPVSQQTFQRGLLGYNGCVRGTNTPNCHTYPSKVKRFVETQGMALCPSRNLQNCIARPFANGLTGAKGYIELEDPPERAE